MNSSKTEYRLDITKQTISVEGQIYSPSDFDGVQTPAFAKVSDFHYSLYEFLCDWFSDSKLLTVHTSGSTGDPKPIMVEKAKMMNSAQLTCSFLDLQEKNKALLCVSLDYIAGKMLVVRSLVGGLDIYPVIPSGNPLQDINIDLDFAAMIPMHVYNCLENSEERIKLEKIKKLIIGGGAIDTSTANTLKEFSNTIYSSYGMTETLSHIALRRVNGEEASDYYTLFDSVKLVLSQEGTLIINAPLVSNEILYTNDIAEISDNGQFKILGRRDNVINSGGMKMQIEEIEELLKPYITADYAITSLPDEKFGEMVVLVLTGNMCTIPLKDILPIYYIPKKILSIDSIPMTETGKIGRKELKELVLKLEEEK